ncbi:hypothetical protein ACSQ67_017300 [Phaseolus vulgaris]
MSDPSHPSSVHGHGKSSSPIDITATLQNHDLQLQEIKTLLHQLVLARDQKSHRSHSHHRGSSLHKASVHQHNPKLMHTKIITIKIFTNHLLN